jgi:nicotinamidase-related amidase
LDCTEVNMNHARTALILIGYQNDYFAPNGVLRPVVEGEASIPTCLVNTLRLLDRVAPLPVEVVSTPILFTPNYSELVEPVGILKAIRDTGAFRTGSAGADVIADFDRFGDRITQIPGKRGLNAFAQTGLDEHLRSRGVTHVALAGVVTALCIDSTGRSAHERGFRVTVLSDCTSGRTQFEQQFYCEQVFPLYAAVTTAEQFVSGLTGDPT